MELLSLSQYARRRGVSQPYISKLIRQGKLHTEPNGKINPAKADAELGRTIDPANKKKKSKNISRSKTGHRSRDSKSPPDGLDDQKKTSFYEARTANEILKAKRAKVEYDKLVGALLPTEDVKQSAFTIGREIRDALTQIPDRIAPLIPDQSDLHQRTQILKVEINAILENMADKIGKAG